MLKRILLYALLCTLLAAPAAPAQDAPRLPDTPVGKQMQQLLASLVNGDYEDYVKNNFSKAFLKEYPLADHLSFFRQMATMHGGFTVHTIEAATEHEMTILGKFFQESRPSGRASSGLCDGGRCAGWDKRVRRSRSGVGLYDHCPYELRSTDGYGVRGKGL